MLLEVISSKESAVDERRDSNTQSYPDNAWVYEDEDSWSDKYADQNAFVDEK